jgi:hypothetical protein
VSRHGVVVMMSSMIAKMRLSDLPVAHKSGVFAMYFCFGL